MRERLAVDVGLSNEYSACDEFVAELVFGHVYLLAEQRNDGVFHGRMSHNAQYVALAYHGMSVHHLVVFVRSVANDARHHEVALQQLAYLLYAIAEDHRVGHLHRECVERHLLQVAHTALGVSLLSLLVDAQNVAQYGE